MKRPPLLHQASIRCINGAGGSTHLIRIEMGWRTYVGNAHLNHWQHETHPVCGLPYYKLGCTVEYGQIIPVTAGLLRFCERPGAPLYPAAALITCARCLRSYRAAFPPAEPTAEEMILRIAHHIAWQAKANVWGTLGPDGYRPWKTACEEALAFLQTL